MENAREPMGQFRDRRKTPPPSPGQPSPAALVLAFHRVTVVGL